MTDWPILSTVTFLPLVGVFLILLIRDEGAAARRNIRNVTLSYTFYPTEGFEDAAATSGAAPAPL